MINFNMFSIDSHFNLTENNMQSYSLTVVPEDIVPPSGGTHVATSWQVALYPDFRNDYFKIADSLVDLANLTSYEGMVDVLNDDKVYYRYKLHFNDGSVSEWSKVYSYLMVPNHLYRETNVIKTPKVIAVTDYTNNIDGELVITSDKFHVYLGNGTHISTSWIILDDLQNEIYANLEDTINLTNLKIPLSLLEDDKLYTVLVKYHDGANIASDYGKFVFNSFIVKGNYYQVTPVNEFILNSELFFNLNLFTTEFKGVDILIKDLEGNIVASNTHQRTITPSVVTSGLLLDTTYEVVSRLKFRDNTFTSHQLIFSKAVKDNLLFETDSVTTYLNKYDFIQELMTSGSTVQSSQQLYDGSILLTTNKSNIISLYKIVNGILTKQKDVISLPVEDNIGIPYINILPLYNGNVVINYGTNTNSLDNQKSVFKLFKYNPITMEFTELNSIIREYEWLSTAVSSSAFVDPSNNIYYVPAVEADTDGKLIPLSMYKLNTTTFEVTKVNDLPFTALKHVSLTPLSKTTFLVYGGSVSSTIVNLKTVWNRDNNNFYLYDTTTNTMTEVGSFDASIDTSYSNFQGYLRRDGKVAMFNSVTSGDKLGIQNVIVLDPSNYSTVITNSDMQDNMSYRSTIVLRSGEYLRFSAKVRDAQVMYKYISNSMSLGELDENTTVLNDPKHLFVSAGEVINIESLGDFDSITIDGDSLESTGILYYQSPTSDNIEEYNYTDLIITKDRTITETEFTTNNWDNITILFGSTLTVSSAS